MNCCLLGSVFWKMEAPIIRLSGKNISISWHLVKICKSSFLLIRNVIWSILVATPEMKNQEILSCRQVEILLITNALYQLVNHLFNRLMGIIHICHKEPLTMGCEIHLESLLYQMYQRPSILPFCESQCLGTSLSRTQSFC